MSKTLLVKVCGFIFLVYNLFNLIGYIHFDLLYFLFCFLDFFLVILHWKSSDASATCSFPVGCLIFCSMCKYVNNVFMYMYSNFIT